MDKGVMRLRLLLTAFFLLLSGGVLITAFNGAGYVWKVFFANEDVFFPGGSERARKNVVNDAPHKDVRKLINEAHTAVLQTARQHTQLAQDYEKTGTYDKALKEYNISLTYNPYDARVQSKVVSLPALLKKGSRVKKAGPADKGRMEGVGQDPGLIADIHYLKGRIYLESNSYEKAINSFSAALKLMPDYLDTKELLARSKREKELAVDFHLKQGIDYFKAEEIELAIKAWNAVLEIDPDNKAAADYRARALLIMERLKEIKEKRFNKPSQGEHM